jgi:soluble lytic murein transglycosylase-like protein
MSRSRVNAGGLMFVMSNTEKSLGAADSIKFYAGVNFPATLYICRYERDDDYGELRVTFAVCQCGSIFLRNRFVCCH